jgi:hypothetical protein
MTTVDRREVLAAALVLTAAALGARARESPGTAAPDANAWREVLRTLFPHPTLDPALYQPGADALRAAAAKDAATATVLAEGWDGLVERAGGDFLAASPETKTRALAAAVGTPFFALLRQTAVFTLYGRPDVGQVFGFDGDAWALGGWLARGLVTVDWVPEPPGVGAR